jgi:uncharacterized protein with HEPN domain
VRDDRAYLKLIEESIGLVEQYVIVDGTPSRKLFEEDPRTQDAALRRMEILADACGHLSAELKDRHPDIHWRQIGNFRNVLAHAYLELELGRIWSAIEEDLPALKAVVYQELEESG